jgi:hypothetical protein
MGDGGVIDGQLRSAAERLSALPISACYVGRRHDREPERVVASVWPSAETMRASLGLAQDGDHVESDRLGPLVEVSVDVLPIAVDLVFDEPTASTLLRVYRGRVQAGDLERYAAEVRAGTIANDAAGHGPTALHLGVAEPDRFVTVSAWTGWDQIEAATGGDIRHPSATRQPERLLEGAVSHYEILPRTESPAARAVS